MTKTPIHDQRRRQRGRGAAPIIAGLLAVGAAGTAGLQMTLAPEPGATERAVSPARAVNVAAGEICILSDLRFVEGMTGRCFSRSDLAVFRQNAVLDASGEPLSLMLSHPTDSLAPNVAASTCEHYERLKTSGWYAMSSREMRRQATFERACQTIRLLMTAAPAATSHFSPDGCSDADMNALAALPLADFGEPAGTETGGTITRDGEGRWRFDRETSLLAVQEIAHADFTGDGRGDILAFMSLNARDGTATGAWLSIFEKEGPAGPYRVNRTD